jgi:hypothetical protein
VHDDTDVRTEPKFEIPSGEVFDGAWCRPQNDGPGLRAITLMTFAESLIAAGDKDYIAANLWTADGSLNGGAIAWDLQYVARAKQRGEHAEQRGERKTESRRQQLTLARVAKNLLFLRSLRSRGAPFFCTRFAPLLPALTFPPPPLPPRYVVESWDSNTCDLWEEVRSTDFFWNRVTMKKAMLMGSAFAEKMGDSKNAGIYAQTAADIDAKLESHWMGTFVAEEENRQKDGAVLVGFNNGFHESDGKYAPTSVEVASTLNVYVRAKRAQRRARAPKKTIKATKARPAATKASKAAAEAGYRRGSRKEERGRPKRPPATSAYRRSWRGRLREKRASEGVVGGRPPEPPRCRRGRTRAHVLPHMCSAHVHAPPLN